MADANKDLNARETTSEGRKDVMSAKSETTTLPAPSRGFEKPKVFPKPEIKRLRIVGGKPSTVPPQAPQGVAEPEKVPGAAESSKQSKEAVPYQPHPRLEWGLNEWPSQLDPHRDWGINEERI
jgi:hypothetical protein